MNELLAAAFFWSLLAVPVLVWLRSFYNRTAESRQVNDDIKSSDVPECLMLCLVMLLVGGCAALDVLPRLYDLLMEMAK